MYKEYLKSLSKGIRQVREALADDVKLAFMEQFDYDFKRELLYHASGLNRYREGIVKRFNNVDYRVASYAAKCFHEIMDLYEFGSYTFRDLKDMAQSFCTTAWVKGITTCRYHTVSWDENGVLYIDLMIDNYVMYSLELDGLETSVTELITLLAHLTAEGYNDPFRVRVETYLTTIFEVVKSGRQGRPLVDTNREHRTLETYLRGAKKAKSVSKYKNVIPYRNAM